MYDIYDNLIHDIYDNLIYDIYDNLDSLVQPPTHPTSLKNMFLTSFVDVHYLKEFFFLVALLISGSREHWDPYRVRPAWVGGSWKVRKDYSREKNSSHSVTHSPNHSWKARKYYSRKKNSSHSGASWSWSCPWLGRHQRGWQPSWCPGSHDQHSHHRPHPRHASTKPKSTLAYNHSPWL